MKDTSRCARCGKSAGPGSAILVSYGAGGRIHKSCVRPEETVRLANGITYKGSPCLNSDAAVGILREATA